MSDNNRDLALQIKRANRDVYNEMSPEKYNENESIFNERRQRTCSKILSEAAHLSGAGSYLDIGTGTGNLLKIAKNHFDACYGVDISENILSKVKSDLDGCYLAASDAESLPFKGEFFDCISCYALLHHLYDHQALFRECARLLKPGGTLYTDHDPNYYFTRFYRIYYRLKYWNRPGFSSDTEELAEYHNTKSSGINPERLKEQLIQAGFSNVAVLYRSTDRSEWSGVASVVAPTLRILAKIVPLKTFFTHFSIIAVK